MSLFYFIYSFFFFLNPTHCFVEAKDLTLKTKTKKVLKQTYKSQYSINSFPFLKSISSPFHIQKETSIGLINGQSSGDGGTRREWRLYDGAGSSRCGATLQHVQNCDSCATWGLLATRVSAKTKNLITLAGLRPEVTSLTWNNTSTKIDHQQVH